MAQARAGLARRVRLRQSGRGLRTRSAAGRRRWRSRPAPRPPAPTRPGGTVRNRRRPSKRTQPDRRPSPRLPSGCGQRDQPQRQRQHQHEPSPARGEQRHVSRADLVGEDRPHDVGAQPRRGQHRRQRQRRDRGHDLELHVPEAGQIAAAAQVGQAGQQAHLDRSEEEQRDPGDDHGVEEHAGGLRGQIAAGDVHRHRPDVEDERLTDAGDEQQSQRGRELAVGRRRAGIHEGALQHQRGGRRGQERSRESQAVAAHSSQAGQSQAGSEHQSRHAFHCEVPAVQFEFVAPAEVPSHQFRRGERRQRQDQHCQQLCATVQHRVEPQRPRRDQQHSHQHHLHTAEHAGPTQHRRAAVAPAGPVGRGPGQLLLQRLEQPGAADVH